MPVAEEHVEAPLTAKIVPPTGWISHAVGLIFPFPVALNNFVYRRSSDGVFLDGRGSRRICGVGVRRDVLHAPNIKAVLWAIAVAILLKTILRPVIDIALVRRASPGTDGRHILV